MNIIRALKSLRPGAEWSLTGEDPENLIWHDTKQNRPTNEEITAEILRLQLNQNSADTNYRNDVNNIYQTNIPEMARKDIKAAEDRMNSDTFRMLNDIEAITQPIPAPKVEKK